MWFRSGGITNRSIHLHKRNKGCLDIGQPSLFGQRYLPVTKKDGFII